MDSIFENPRESVQQSVKIRAQWFGVYNPTTRALPEKPRAASGGEGLALLGIEAL